MSARSKDGSKSRSQGPGAYNRMGAGGTEGAGAKRPTAKRKPTARAKASKLGPLGMNDARVVQPRERTPTPSPSPSPAPSPPPQAQPWNSPAVRAVAAAVTADLDTDPRPQDLKPEQALGNMAFTEKAPEAPRSKKPKRVSARRTESLPNISKPTHPRRPSTLGRRSRSHRGMASGDYADLPALAQVPIGTVVDNNYTVMEKLGEGGMGMVLRCRDGQLERDVALKMIRPALMVRKDMRERFLVEAQAMARVSHPNVVKIFAFGEHMGGPYFVMELVQGITVDSWFWDTRVARGTLPTVDEILGIFDQCCRGVSAVHASGTLHGDLKPSNVLLGDKFRVAITDLGLACMMDRGEYESVAGTPAYMAPEGLDPVEDPDLASRRDVYSLGVIAYELLTGQLPHEVATVQDFVELPNFPAPQPASELRADLPSAFDAPLERALQLDPRDRTESADALMADLMSARRSVTRNRTEACILVADDDPDFLNLVKRTLAARLPDAEIITVPDGERAIEEFGKRKVNLAIIDLNMPGANGIEVTTALRDMDSARRSKILVVTAFGGGRDWNLLSGLGADSFLVKPFDLEAFVATVTSLLNGESSTAAAGS